MCDFVRALFFKINMLNIILIVESQAFYTVLAS